MAEDSVAQRLRRFLLGVVAAIFVGTVLELLLIGHYEDLLQWTPFIASGVGLILAGTIWFTPTEPKIWVFRWGMGIIALSSFVGMYLHFSGNLAFAREIHPSFTFWQSLWAAFTGSNPIMAPGILFLAGLLGIASTYKHPVLADD